MIAWLHFGHAPPHLFDDASSFMSENTGWIRDGQMSIPGCQIRVTDTSSDHSNYYFIVPWFAEI
jgi:hypothetical protein